MGKNSAQRAGERTGDAPRWSLQKGTKVVQGDVVAPLWREATMNDKIATAFLATLAGAIVIGIL
jgi:hypothetical protein